MSTYNQTPYWPEDYFNQFFRSSGGGAIVGSLRGSAAGVATVTGTLTEAGYGHSGVVRLAGGLSLDRIDEMLAWVRTVSLGLNVVCQEQLSAQEAKKAEALALELAQSEAALLSALARREASRVVRVQENDDEEAIMLLLAA